ncbi:MAG: DUF58 domain-containing protein [Planctomycetota bacterium]
MTRSRTRYRIGSGGLLYGLVSGVILAAAVYTQANLLFWGFGLMVGGMVISLLLAAVGLWGLEVERSVPEHGAVGEALALRYRVQNRGWLPMFAVVLQELGEAGADGKRRERAGGGILGGSPMGWVLHVGAKQAVQTLAPCRPRARGVLRLRRIEASTSFPFSVIYKSVVFEQADEVLVFPALYRVRRKLLTVLSPGDGDGRQSVRRPQGGEEFFGLREYRPGDSPRMIDWKRTARVGTRVARESTTPRAPRLAIVLDLRGAPPMGVGGRGGRPGVTARELEERAISLAASLVCEAHLAGYRTGLRVLGFGELAFGPRHGLMHRTRLLEALAGLNLRERDAGGTAGRAGLGRSDLIVWAGRGAGLPSRAGGQTGVAAVLGGADFERYVTDPTGLATLSEADGRGRTGSGRGGSDRGARA